MDVFESSKEMCYELPQDMKESVLS